MPCTLDITEIPISHLRLAGWLRRLLGRAQVRLHGLVAGELLLRLLVGDGRRDDHVLALLPVHRGRDLVRGRELQRVERSEEHTSELQSQSNLVCRLLLEKKK